jgi:SAM-dependent methyltransferase
VKQPIRAAAIRIDRSRLRGEIGGYPSLVVGDASLAPDVTTDEYAADQESVNVRKTVEYLLPMIEARGAKSVVDIGCGVGAMVRTLLDAGCDAYGVDLPQLHRHWARLGLPTDRMFVIAPDSFGLPFADDSVDFVYTLGVIEHVGTSNGHSDRLPDYHVLRERWLREVFRIVRPGGCMLVGGPNRGFPVDVAHDLDSRASWIERWISGKLKASVHRTWGENFLWAYKDIDRYLEGLDYTVVPQSIAGFLSCARVPAIIRPLAQYYVDHVPRPLRGTGFNPWVMAIVTKTEHPGFGAAR